MEKQKWILFAVRRECCEFLCCVSDREGTMWRVVFIGQKGHLEFRNLDMQIKGSVGL